MGHKSCDCGLSLRVQGPLGSLKDGLFRGESVKQGLEEVKGSRKPEMRILG